MPDHARARGSSTESIVGGQGRTRRSFGDDCVLTRSLEFEVLNEGFFIF